jgi:hypothetical protein
MADEDDPVADEADGTAVIRFPQSRVRPPGSPEPFKDLGMSKLSLELGSLKEQNTGHWCSHCKGIWFGYLLEAECPVCGNRNG